LSQVLAMVSGDGPIAVSSSRMIDPAGVSRP